MNKMNLEGSFLLDWDDSDFNKRKKEASDFIKREKRWFCIWIW